ncbi:unnamed protein product [Durusdinium trenchii]|uniref:Rhamnosyl O-methyltransferase n=2 Tax=Durusdinium trenchii TaxID=1381693 RepID=A0ABP0JAC6_9DINO
MWLVLALSFLCHSSRASVTTLRIRDDEQTLCTGVGRPDQECLTVKDFTQEELLAVLEPLLARMPAESARHYYWSSILCSLVVTFTTWAFLLSCFRSCCRQKTGRKTRQTCSLLRRWAGDLCDVFFTFPLMGAKMIFGKIIVAPITAARLAMQDIQTEQTLRLQQQLLAEGQEASSPPQRAKRERASVLRGKRPPDSRRAKEKPKEPSAKKVPRPETAVSAHDPSEVLDEELSEDWCQVYRHSEARRNAAALREEKRDKAEPTPPAAPVAVPVAAASVRSKAAPKVQARPTQRPPTAKPAGPPRPCDARVC